MKIAIVGPGIMPIPPVGWGAVEILIWDYAQVLRNMGHEVLIVNTPDRNEIIRQIREFKPQFVHIQYDDFADIAGVISQEVGAVAITSHYGYLEQPHRWGDYRHVFRRCTNYSQSNIYHFALSEGIAKIYESHAGISRNKIYVTPNGADDSKFRYTKMPLYPDRTICVGKIESRKGQHLLHHNNEIWFVGNRQGSEFNYSHSNYLGEWNKETLYNSLTDYGNFVLISDGEADPLVVKEALVAGLGVVVTEVAAANLDRTKPFISIIPNDKKGDRAFIDNLIRENRRISTSMRDEIRDYSKNFFWTTLVEKYIKLVQGLLGVSD